MLVKQKPEYMWSVTVCSGNSLDSSPNYSAHVSKSKVRKSFEGLIRRLSGGRDSQVCNSVVAIDTVY